MNLRQITATMRLLEPAIRELHRLGYGVARGTLRGTYAEFYAARKIIHNTKENNPQLGPQRQVKKSDIYLPTLEKSVEVKSTNGQFAGEAIYSWSFTENQGRKKPFDYVILIGFDDKKNSLLPEMSFIMPKKDLPDLKHKDFETETDFGIKFYHKPSLAKTAQDKRLSYHASKYRSA